MNVTTIFNNQAVILLIAIVAISILWWFLSHRQKRNANIPYFDSEAMDVAKASAELKMKHDYEELLPQHFLWALLNKPGKKLNEILYQHGLNSLEGKKLLEEMLVKKSVDNSQSSSRQLHVGKHVKQVIDQAGINMERRKASKITPTDLFEALLEMMASSNESVYDETKSFINSVGISLESILEQLKKTLGTNEATDDSLKR